MSDKRSLSMFWGGFLSSSCIPVELWLNWCSHNCYFCFANLNDPDRKANIKQIMGLLNRLNESPTLEAQLLREGYPVVFSNRVDPLAVSNEMQSLVLIETFEEMGIPYTIQSRGGRKFDELFSLISRPIVWYISIETLDDEIAKKISPGAPPPSQRLKMVQKLSEAGHYPLVGINPINPSWTTQPRELVEAIYQAGVYGCWIQPLHLSNKQIGNMPDRGIKALGDDAIRQARDKQHQPTIDLYHELFDLCFEYDLPSYDNQMGSHTTFFNAYRVAYEKTYPMLQDFVNYCFENKEAGDCIYWEEFRDLFCPLLPSGDWSLRDHLNALVLPQLLNGLYIPQRMSYEKLLWFIWQYKETILCPANIRCFAWAATLEDEEKAIFTRYVDDNDMPILVFLPQGCEWAYVDIPLDYILEDSEELQYA